jgi:hypothetical protein
MVLDEELLNTEIDFWQDMIDLRRKTASPESLERMQQALALVELKLQKTGSDNKWRNHV